WRLLFAARRSDRDDEEQDSGRGGAPPSATERFLDRPKSIALSTSVGCWPGWVRPRLHRVITRLRLLFEPEPDDLPPPERSRRDRLTDWTLILLALGFGTGSFVTSVQHGLRGALLVVDVVLGVGLTTGLWWRRRLPGALALASLLVLPISSFA